MGTPNVEGRIDVGDLTGRRDANIHLKHVAGRGIVTHYHYYGVGPEKKGEEDAGPLVWPDGLPEVGDLPPGSRPVHGYNRLFVGREEELTELARLLQTGETAVIGEVAGITGRGSRGCGGILVMGLRRGRGGGRFATLGVTCKHISGLDSQPAKSVTTNQYPK